MLTFIHVKKRYGNRIIIEVPSLTISGGVHWLKGSNGSGKSTLLKMAGGLIPFEGDINIDDVDLKKQPTDYRRLVSYAEAEPMYPDFIAGQDLVRFYKSVRKADVKDITYLIAQFGIGDYYKKPIGTYSSGMIKKLSLVLALIGYNKFIFFDEPFVTLDQQSTEVLYELVKTRTKQGTNFIFTSHQEMNPDHWQASVLLVKDQTVCFQ